MTRKINRAEFVTRMLADQAYRKLCRESNKETIYGYYRNRRTQILHRIAVRQKG